MIARDCLKIFHRLIYVFIGIFLLAETIFLISPKVVNINNHKEEINKIAMHMAGVDLGFENINFKTYPDFSVKIFAKNIDVKNLAKIEDLELKIGLPKLIFKKLSVRELKTHNTKINIVRFEDNSTNIDKVINKLPVNIELNKTKIDINNYKLFFNDKFVNQNTLIEGEKIYAKIDRNDLDAVIKGRINSKNEDAVIDLSIKMPMPDLKKGFKNRNKYIILIGSAKNIHPEIFKEYIKTYINNDIENLTGTINADFKPSYDNNELKAIDVDILIDNLKIISKYPENSIIFNGKNNITSNLVIDKNKLEINNFEYAGYGYNITMNGIIDKFKSKKPKADLDIKINNSKVEKLYWMLPSNLFTNLEEIKKIKKYGAYGIVNGNIQIKGFIEKPYVYGHVDANDVWILDELPSDVPKAYAKIYFEKDIVKTDVKVWATPEEYVTVTGYSNFYNLSDNEYKINSTDSVPLGIAQKMLIPVSEVLGFMIGPVPIMKIEGFGNIDLYAKGSKENPYLKGKFNFKNATASFNDIHILELKNASGKIDFNKDKVYFKNDTGTILGQNAYISGVSDSKFNIDYNAEVKDISLNELLKILKTSPMLEDYSKQVKMIDEASGTADFTLQLPGKFENADDILNKDVMKFLKPKGQIKVKNSSIKLNNPKALLSKTNGDINFDNKKVNLEVVSQLYESPIKVNGEINNNNSDLKINSQKMKLVDSVRFLINFVSNDVEKKLKLKDFSQTTTFNFDMEYKGNIESIELDKVNLKAIFNNKTNSTSLVDVLSGSIYYKNGDLELNKLNSKFYNTTAYFNGKINNALKKPIINMDLSISKLDFDIINYIKQTSLLPEKYNKILNAYKDFEGVLTTKLNIKNNKINGNIWLRDIAFKHAILEYPFSLKSADFKFSNNNLNINSFNASFASTPVFLNGNIKNITKNPDFDIFFTSKLSKEFVDNYINTNLSYPINVKGEILLSSRIQGFKDKISLYPSIKLEEGANVSYMGANLGDENSIREIKGDLHKIKDTFVINNIDYSKYIYSQNNILYPLPLLNIKAEIKNIKNKPYIEYLNIVTKNPVNANLFNALLKKSLIKNGNITCNLNMKGNVELPDIIGDINLQNINIPSYNTSAEDIKIKFHPKYIDIYAKTNYLNSDIDIIAKLRNNKFKTIHFDYLEFHSKKMDLNKLLDSLNDISYLRPIQIVGQTTTQEQIPFNIKNLIIESGKFKIDEIAYKTLAANELSADLNFKNGNMYLKNSSINIAGGKIQGDVIYNVEKALIKLKASANDVDINEIAYNFLDIKNQIFGKVNGTADITTFGANDEERLQNLNGELKFKVLNGKMPKLGSIEYLLRAGNLIKGGIKGLTLNNITSLLVPVQTGNFEEINGDLILQNGTFENMKIYSKGKNLSILITGDYDLVSTHANINVLGKLSKNINSFLGPIGNASINSFFNLIPGVHLDELKDTDLVKQINSIPELSLETDKFRIFRAIVDGDIYTENFVSKFEWIDK